MMEILCLLGLHLWHPTARITSGRRVCKEVCTRCGKRKWR